VIMCSHTCFRIQAALLRVRPTVRWDRFVGILSCDKSSYICDKTPFQPAPPIAPSGKFTMEEFATFAQGA
jgi:hypothetical protein